MNTLHSDEQFLSYYQFSHDPFAARVPNFKFFSAQRKTILGQMHHLARHSQLMLIITGPKDSGKTLLRQALIASLNKETVNIVNASAKDCSKPSQIIALLSDELKLTESIPEAIIEELNKLSEKDAELYLMIDDAEALPEDALQLLLNLTSEQLKNLHIFLFARPVLLEKLEDSTLGKEVTFNLPLTPYTLEETKEYLALRLEGARQTIDLFTDDQLFDVYTRSGGWPGTINEVAKELLLADMDEPAQEPSMFHQKNEKKLEPTLSFDTEKDDEPRLGSLFSEKEEKTTDFFAVEKEKATNKTKSSSFIPKKHLAIAGIVAVVLLAIIFFSRSSNTPVNDKEDNIVADHYATISDTQTQTINLPLTSGEETTQSNTVQNGTSNNLPLTNNDTVPTTDIPVPTNDTTAQLPATSGGTQNTGSVTTNTVNEPSTTSETSQQTETKTNTTMPTTAQTTGTKTKTTTKPVVEPVKSQTTTRSLSLDNAWYKNQTNAYYTIQVSVASNERSAQDFIKKQSGDYRFYKRSRAGRVDYVITYGRFSGRTLAQNEIKKLPQDIQRSKPWVRTFASIKPELAR